MTGTALQLDAVIAEATGVTGAGGPVVWVYGEMLWAKGEDFDFVPVRDTAYGRRLTLTTSVVTRYRDGDSSMFLLSMPAGVAERLGITAFAVEGDELERLRSRCTRF